jgi:nitrite reductase/ring-hydroxylating ferredoxin subunit
MVAPSRVVLLPLVAGAVYFASRSFVLPSPLSPRAEPSLRGGVAAEGAGGRASGASAAVGAGAICSLGAVAAFFAASRRSPPPSKTAAKYSTATIFPSLVWSKTGIRAGDLAPKQLKAVEITGVDCLVGKTEGGKIFVVQNNCPHIGTPLSTGADVIGNSIICPLHGSAFDVYSGDVLEWSTQPPIIGPLSGMLVEQAPIVVFQVRENLFNKGEIEVLVDQNARKAYEAPYWKGILDAQGKNDGTYY